MKCLKISCTNEAKPGWDCCNIMHGADVKMYRSEILKAGENHDKKTLAIYTIEDVLTYL